MRLLIIFLFLFVFFSQAQNSSDKILVQLKNGDIRSFIQDEALSLKSVRNIKHTNIFSLHLNREVNTEYLQSLFEHPSVVNIQFNRPFDWRRTPNDSLFKEQWGMLNDGNNGWLSDADIDAELAWDFNTGGINVHGDTLVVAVIDAGFEMEHPDLNYVINKGEIPDNMIDDDGNGYVDDYLGYNAFDKDGEISTDFHGTHVAGIAAAKGNNSSGVAGVNWDAKVLAIQGNALEELTVIEGYAYVLNQRKLFDQTNGEKGALIVATNSSFGVDEAFSDDYPIWCAFYDSLGEAGILNAVSGPNNNVNVDVLGDVPATCPSDYVIAVANSDSEDLRYSSGYGSTHIDLAAPGTAILSTIPQNFGGNWYGNSTGTSMSAPMVAGAIVYAFSVGSEEFWTAYKNNPASIAKSVKWSILNGVDEIPEMNGESTTGGRLNLLGVYEEMQSVLSSVKTTKNELDKNVFINSNNQIVLLWEGSKREVRGVQIYNSLGQIVYTNSSVVSEKGMNEMTLSALSVSPGVYFIHWNGDKEAQSILVQ